MYEKKSRWKGVLLFFGIVLALFAGMLAVSNMAEKKDYFGGSKVALVRLEGIIKDSKDVLEQLKEYTKNPTVKAIVLRVDSPGGGVAPSQEIYDAISKIRREGKQKVVVSMGSIAASGGYYVSCNADRIVADPGTITGSIGVIMEFANVQELLKKIGLNTVIIKTGPHKDIGSPTRPMTEEEKKLLQGVINDVYEQFLDVIAEGRKIDKDKLRSIADGRIFSGRQALELGLVDELGSLDHAVDVAADLAGIKKRPVNLIEKKKKFSLLEAIDSLAQKVNPRSILSSPGISLEYRLR